MATGRSTIRDLNKRSRDIFTTIVDAYVETGEPIGSKTLSQILKSTLSPATLRNVMADLEDAGLLYSPHTSAGRLPTHAGLRIPICWTNYQGYLRQSFERVGKKPGFT
jgi:heat-inducible transcriptional repressor